MVPESGTLEVDLGPVGSYIDFLQAELARRQFPSKGERTRFRLKLAGAQMLEEGGFQNLKVADICRQAGLASGTFYVYFQDKSEIATEILLEFGDTLYAQAQNATRGSSSFEAVLLTNQFFVAAYQCNAGLTRCLIQLEDQIAEFRQRWRERRMQWIGRIASSIARRAAPPEAPESLRMQMAYALEGMVFHYLYDVFVRREPVLSDMAGNPEYIAELLSILWYRAVYCSNPPADLIVHARSALTLKHK